MKRTISILVAAFLSLILFNQSGKTQNCIFCNSNTVGDSSSAIGAENISTGKYSLASGFQNVASGEYSFAGGESSIASQKWAFAFGQRAQAEGFRSFAQGMDVKAMGTNSVVIGRYARTLTGNAMVIGYGVDGVNANLDNGIAYSLMIGFNSDIPTLFVGNSSGAGTIGNVGIGTTEPEKTLEVNGTFKVNDWSYMRTIDLDNSDIKNIDELQGNGGLKFKGETSLTNTQMILSEEGNLGIGILEPAAKLQVNGDIFIDDLFSGLILKSPDGQCWKGTADNTGSFILESINCNLFTGEDDTQATQQLTARIFPNPAGNKLTVELPSDIQQAYASFYNEQGILLLQKEITGGNNLISLKKLPLGILVVKVFIGNGELISVEKVLHQ